MLDECYYENIANFTGIALDAFNTPVKGSVMQRTEINRDPSMSLSTTGLYTGTNGVVGGTATAGGKVTITYNVTNTGTTRLDHIIVTDAKLGTCNLAVLPLNVGASESCSITYTLVPNDPFLSAGQVVSSAVADATVFNDPQLSPPEAKADVLLPLQSLLHTAAMSAVLNTSSLTVAAAPLLLLLSLLVLLLQRVAMYRAAASSTALLPL